MSMFPQRWGVEKGCVMDDVIGITAVISEHVTGDHRVRLEFVGSGCIGALPSGFINIGTVGVEPELV